MNNLINIKLNKTCKHEKTPKTWSHVSIFDSICADLKCINYLTNNIMAYELGIFEKF